MVRSKRFLGYVGGAFAALAIGCGPGTPAGDSGPGTDASGDAPTAGQEYVYVINALTVDPGTSDTAPRTGFNLDGLYSTIDDANGCMYDDHSSMLDNDQNCPAGMVMNGRCMAMPNAGCAPGANCRGGVDNRLPGLADTLQSMLDIRQTLTTQISSNALSLILRVSDVNDLQNDPSVRVRLYAGYPTFSTGCTGVMPDREYTIAADSLTAGATSIDAAQFNFEASIVNGRLRVDGSTSSDGRFQLPLPEVMGMRIVLSLYNPQLRLNLSATEGSAGNLGGAVRAGELIDAVGRAAPMYATLVRSVVVGLVDIQPNPPLTSGVCADTMTMMYGSIGMGLGLTAVRARLASGAMAISAARPAGACGSAPRDN